MKSFLTSTAIFLMTTTFAAADAVEICLFEEEDWVATLAACNEALAASDDPVEQGRFILHRGIAHEFLGDLEAARLDQVLAGEYRPDWFLAYANAATLNELLGDEEGHYRMAHAAIDADPENPRAYLELLYLLANSDDVQSCLPVADQIISLLDHPIDWPFANTSRSYLMGNLGFCLQENGRHEEALRAYLSAEYMGLEVQWLSHQLADLAYFELEQDERAIDAATRALAYDEPYYQDVFILVAANMALGRFDDAVTAVTAYAAVLDAAEEDSGTRNLIGWALFLRGRSAEASPIMEAWVTRARAHGEANDTQIGHIWDTVAHVRAAVGDTEGAAEAFRLAFDLYEDRDEVRELYRREMTGLGFDVAEGDEGIRAALDACAATGPACRMVPVDEELTSE